MTETDCIRTAQLCLASKTDKFSLVYSNLKTPFAIARVHQILVALGFQAKLS